MADILELEVDPIRAGRDLQETGIPVRARLGEKWGAWDIVFLREASLDAWLRSRGGQNEFAENVVKAILGYER